MASSKAAAAQGGPDEENQGPGKGGGQAALLHRHLFGIKTDVKNHVHFIDEAVVAYPCGHSTVLYNMETREQTLVHGLFTPVSTLTNPAAHNAHAHGAQGTEGMTAMALSPSKKLLAVAERGSERGSVAIYDTHSLKRRKVLSYVDLGSREIVCLAFSADSKTLAVLGGAPDYTLVLYSLEKGAKIMTSLKLNTLQQGTGTAPAATPSGLGHTDRSGTGTAAVSQHSKHGTVGSPGVLRQVDFCPSDHHMLCVSGNGFFKLLKVSEGNLRVFQVGLKKDLPNIMCHCWLDDEKLILGTEHGDMLVLESGELKTMLSSAPGNGETINSLCSTSKGFVCGTIGRIRIYERSDDLRELFKCSRIFPIHGDETSAVLHLAVSPSEEMLLVTSSNRQLYSFALSNVDILKEDAPSNFELVTGCRFHGPASPQDDNCRIHDIDTCVWKPLVATCGVDKSVRLFNYKAKITEIVKHFTEEPISVALHPSGLSIAVGFPDKLRLMSILMDDLSVVRMIPIKNCTQCKFSEGGHLLAVVNQNLCTVFDAYSCDIKLQLKGHQQAIVSVMFGDRDRRIVTVGKDGSMFLWDTRTGERLQECLQPRTSFLNAVTIGDAISPTSRCFTCASDLTLRSFLANKLMPEKQVSADIAIKSLAVARNGRALFAGTAEEGRPSMLVTYIIKDGTLPGRSNKPQGEAAAAGSGSGEDDRPTTAFTDRQDPHAVDLGDSGGPAGGSTPEDVIRSFSGSPGPSSLLDSQSAIAHALPVAAMSLSADGRFLFSAGEDGTLCMFEVREVDGRGVVRLQTTSKDKPGSTAGAGGGGGGMIEGSASSAIEFAEEILITKSTIVEKKKEHEALAVKVEELKLNNEHQLRQKDIKYHDRIQDITDKFKVELDTCVTDYDGLSTDKLNMESRYEERMQNLKLRQTQELEERKKQYQEKISTEQKRKEALQEERKALQKKWEAHSAELVQQHTEDLNELTTTYDARTAKEQEAQSELQGEKDDLMQSWERTKSSMEMDADLEVQEIKLRFEQKLKAEQELTLSLKGENVIMKKKYQVLVKEVKEQDDEIRGLGESEKQLRETLKGLEKDIHGHKKEIREREETIADKDKRIFDLKKKNQELEKFKFVLDYKIKELKRQIEPRENEIADMRSQVEEMDLELEQYHKSNSALDLMVGELKLKMDGMQREINRQLVGIAKAQDEIDRFKHDLKGCTKYLRDYKRLKSSIRALYAKYVQELAGVTEIDDADGATAETDIQIEFNRQREHLERNVEALKKNIQKDLDMFSADHTRLVRESVGLTEEMNNLRREAKVLRRQAKAMDLAAATTPSSSLPGGDGSMPQLPQYSHVGSVTPVPPQGSSRGGSGHGVGSRQITGASAELYREMEMQDSQIEALEGHVRKLQETLGIESIEQAGLLQ